MTDQTTPSQQGYFFPAEFARHDATWLSWPHKEASWPGTIKNIFPFYARFVREISLHERVCINVSDETMRDLALTYIVAAGADTEKISFHFNPTNDAWCRDHGPAFLINPAAVQKKVIVDWNYNAWGNKYPPYDLDDVVPSRIGKELNIPVFHPGIVMEGGSVDFNGEGTVLTSESCLLNPNRNPHLHRDDIERYLMEFYGVRQVLWVPDGIAGDDTDGHIDDTIRFVNSDTVLSVVEEDKNDVNFELLRQNLRALNTMRLLNGKQLNVIELPMPDKVEYEGQRLPASYANFYITNGSVIVPTYRSKNDDKALQVIGSCFPGRDVVGIDSTEIIWGLGSFHCLSQQEPSV